MATMDRDQVSAADGQSAGRGLLEITPLDLKLISDNENLSRAIVESLVEAFFDRLTDRSYDS
jgi:hypothetical protein